MQQFGGKITAVSMTGQPVWNFGWISPAQRTDEQQQFHATMMAEMPKFCINGSYADVDKACLWKFSKQVNNDQHLTTLHQVTGSCFPAGVQVRMADGSKKCIEKIVVGELVKTHTGESRKVVRTFSREYCGDLITISTENCANLTMTSDHKVGVVDDVDISWVSACSLNKNHTLIVNGKHEKLASKVLEEVKELTVYDIEVEVDHSFLAKDIVVHNCVGHGGGNAIWYTSAVQEALGQPYVAKRPFYLLTYGRSRYYAFGQCGEGEGSFGSAFAKAAREDGTVAFDEDGLPKASTDDGVVYGQSVEMKWSDGCEISQDWLAKAKQHRVKTTAAVKTADDVKAALINGYSVSIASDWGGEMSPQVQGNPGVLLNRRVTQWQHQMSCQGYWRHPSLGEIFYILNSWGPNAHGQDPSGAPPGGFWVKKADIDYITGQDDSFAFSGFEGFPAQTIDWYM